ncbi:MAG: Rieske 2Fe-2S domain-containing protein [Dehalococcoidia bacterium]|nr:Rieske 2Fe-2S domain-containing protein [Dehalococcoidia bacterium]
MSIFKAVLGICETKPLSGDLWSLEGNKVQVKLSHMPEPLPKGGAVYLRGGGLPKPVLILRTEDDRYLAFEDRCTHFGRKLDPVPGEAKLRCCSLFHSTYDLEGKNISGAAKRPLTSYAVEQSDGDLIITL